MNYGFLIRNDRCIGCHACSTACKSENDVPLGVNRTWVKSVEKGRYPDVQRSFQVTRCNHCANPPCVRICPVTAMYQRSDGIVEFDPDRCIGCKACLQACPYDAIYIDPSSGTAAKCHYCAHRTDIGLEPACVVVCPEHAIIAGDLNDPASEISSMLTEFDVTVRKPEQNTAPKLFYVEGDEAALEPTLLDRQPAAYAWTDVVPLDGEGRGHDSRPHTGQAAFSGGPIHVAAGPMVGEMVQGVYNAQHRVPWHWPVPGYLVTKAIACGLMMLMAGGYLLGAFGFDATSFLLIGALSLFFQGATTGLLVIDLERPERFLRVLTRPQWRSWLVRGAYFLVAFSLVSGGWWVSEFGGVMGWWSVDLPMAVRTPLLALSLPLALGSAVYTGFLFAQAEGRDLWQGPLLPLHLAVQAVMAGSAAALLIEAVVPLSAPLASVAWIAFVVSLAVDLAMVIVSEFVLPHPSDNAAAAAHGMVKGRYRWHTIGGGILLGHVVPLSLALLGGGPVVVAIGALAALVGLFTYEYAFVMAPQEIPNS